MDFILTPGRYVLYIGPLTLCDSAAAISTNLNLICSDLNRCFTSRLRRMLGLPFDSHADMWVFTCGLGSDEE